MLCELGYTLKPTIMCQDNNGSIYWANNSEWKEFSKRRHVDVRYHYVRSLVQQGKIIVKTIPGKQMKADFLTKILGLLQLRRRAFKLV